ncbi:hypothetical protein [Clostridium tunisiense]|uniref:hypothetical protein n=1 Tax=Clostridium tunisiense TaxID=219748 RepID=UPI00031F06E4|nr:hypothetical protein [Clostridium tunisiense]
MCKVISEFRVKNYAVLKLDEDKPLKKYSKYLIDGLEYEIVPVYDSPRCIAIESNDSFLNKEIKFI